MSLSLTNLPELGMEVARLRREKGLTQRQLTDQSGLAQPTLAKLEMGSLSELGSRKLLRLFDLLNPYKATVDHWLWPDAFKNQNTSVVKAKKAIAGYKKASGSANGLAELKVFYCERAAGFSCDVGLADEGYFGALVRMFEQALKTIATLPGDQRPALWARLDAVRQQSHEIGYGVGDNMDALFDARQGDA